MYVNLNITKWENPRSSGHRIGARDGGAREFIINPSKIVEIKANGTGSKFYFNDCIFNRRDKPSYVEAAEAPQVIIDAYDVPTSNTITLPVYRNNNVNASTTNITILTDSLVYADRYNGSPVDTSWVVVEEGGFSVKAKKVLVAMSIEEILTGTSTLVDYDGNGYTTVVIGDLEWIVENLRTTHYGDGTAIANITDNILWLADTAGAYCWYANDILYKEHLGALYNWHALDSVHGLAYFERGGMQQAGWRVATYVDWMNLVTAVGGLGESGKVKEVGFVHWDPPNLGATDEYGFRAVGNGNRYCDTVLDDGFYGKSVYADMWMADEVTVDTANAIWVDYGSTDFNGAVWHKYCGLAVRCVRDVS